jgi:hypothetical protein
VFISAHAAARLRERLPDREADGIVARLEAAPGSPGLVAFIVDRHPGEHRGDLRRNVAERASNGDTVVAIARDGEVTTVYYRRSWDQTLTAHGLGVGRVVRWCAVA